MNIGEEQDYMQGEDKQQPTAPRDKYLFTIEGNADLRPLTTIKINGCYVKILIDSGSGSNVIDEVTFYKLCDKPKLKATSTRIYAFDSKREIPVKGEFRTRIELEGQRCVDEFLVVVGAPGNLLSFKTARRLNAFGLEIFKEPKEQQCLKIENKYERLMTEYKDVFTKKIGCLKDCKVYLQIDESVRPTIQSYRRPPYHLAEATARAIDELIKYDIIEPAPQPIKWLSQLVIVPKEKKPDEVRITVDSRVANKAIIKSNFVTPTLEEIKYDLNDSVVFSELYCVKAFHQLELGDDMSRYITTFEC